MNKTLLKIILLITQIAALFALMPVIFIFLMNMPVFIIILPLIFFGIVCFMIYKTIATEHVLLKSPSHSHNIPYNQIFLTIYITLCIAIIAFVLYLGYTAFNSRPPNFFPFNDPQATYTVTKSNDIYSINYNSTSSINTHQNCEPVRDTFVCHTEVLNQFQIIIGKSAVNLNQFLGKHIQLKGSFVYDDKQCIHNTCIKIGNHAVLNIDEIKIVPIKKVSS